MSILLQRRETSLCFESLSSLTRKVLRLQSSTFSMRLTCTLNSSRLDSRYWKKELSNSSEESEESGLFARVALPSHSPSVRHKAGSSLPLLGLFSKSSSSRWYSFLKRAFYLALTFTESSP